jgi:hypothetical protein
LRFWVSWKAGFEFFFEKFNIFWIAIRCRRNLDT